MDMEECYLAITRCVLCRRKYDEHAEFRNIKETNVHTSKKTIKEVLGHLAKCIKGEVILQDNSYVCGPCYEKLAEYDQIMLQLLMHQRELSRLLETSMNTLDFYDDYDESIIKEEYEELIVKDDETISKNENEDLPFKEDGSEDSMESLSDKDNGRNEDDSQDTAQDLFTIPTVTTYQCSICGKKLSSKFALRMHLDSHAKAKACHICGVLRRDEEYLELHMNVHEGKSENECRYCPKQYSRRSNVIRHMHMHWDKKKFQCEKCGLRFSQGNLLYNHKMHHDAEEQPLVCSQCDQSFKSKKTYNHHMLTHQEDRPLYPCEVCGKKFTEKYTLKTHSKTHINNYEKDPDSKKKRELTTKKKLNQKEFPCIICDRVLGAKDILEAHMAADHDVIGPLKVFS